MDTLKNKILIETNDILDLIICAQAYSFENSVLFTTFRDWLGSEITEKQIENFLNEYRKNPDYGDEDIKEFKEILNDFIKKYCNEKKPKPCAQN